VLLLLVVDDRVAERRDGITEPVKVFVHLKVVAVALVRLMGDIVVVVVIMIVIVVVLGNMVKVVVDVVAFVVALRMDVVCVPGGRGSVEEIADAVDLG